MDEFMLVVRGYDYANVTPEVMEKRMNAYRPWMEKMVEAGHYKAGQPLEPGSGRLLKDRNTVLTDGPFLESKEIIGGYVILFAKDYDQAVAFAKECPLLDHCSLEVRKLGQM
jgi:hypothetical protein